MRTRGKQPAKRDHPAVPMPEEVASLFAERDARAAERLRELGDSEDRTIAKAARRALYLLRAAGIEPPPQEAAPRLRPGVETAARAMMTGAGNAGERMLFFVRDDPYGGSPTFAVVVTRDTSGVEEIAVRRIKRRDLAEEIARLRDEERSVLADVPLDFARWKLSQAENLNVSTRKPLPEGFSQLKEMVGEPEGDYPEHPVYQALPPGELLADQSYSRSAETLFEAPLFTSWFLDLAPVDEWERKYFEAMTSQLVLSEAQRKQQGERVVEEAAAALIDAGEAALWKTRLEDTAYVLLLAGREAEARQAMFHALQINPDRPPQENGFFRTLVNRSIYAVMALKAHQEEEAEKARRSSGIIRP